MLERSSVDDDSHSALAPSLFPTSGFTKEGFEAACAKYIAHDVSIVTPSGKRLGLAEFKSKFIGACRRVL